LKIEIKSLEKNDLNFIIWDDFLPIQHHLKSNHLNAFEYSVIEDIICFRLVVYNNRKLIGLVYLQQFNFKHKHLNFERNKHLLSKVLKLILPNELPIIVCGSLFRINYQGFYFKNPLHNKLIFEVIREFKKKNIHCKSSAVIIKDCNQIFIDSSYKKMGYTFFNGDVTMEITRRDNWNNFKDYLNDLNKKYLQRAEKIIDAFKTLEVKEFGDLEIQKNSTQIINLYTNVISKQIVRLGTINVNYFVELKKDLKDKFEFHAIYDGAKMVGFYTFIFYEKDMETHYIGLDYEANKKFQLYFNILFISTNKMIEKRFNSMELGRTAREAKSNLGALPKQIFNYIKLSNPIAKMTLNYFLKSFNEKESQNVINRSPLK
jgi:hypothetical protein